MSPAERQPSHAPAPDPALQRRIHARVRDFDVPALLDLLVHLGYRLDEIELRGHLARSPQPTLVHDIVFLDQPRAPDPAGRAGTGPDSDHDVDIFDQDTLEIDLAHAILDRLSEFDGDAPPGPRPGPGPDAGVVMVAATAGARVIVTVNLGLLSCRSPLPSYFDALLARFGTREPLMELIHLLDRSLLRDRLHADRPDRMFHASGDASGGAWGTAERDLLRLNGLASLSGLDWLFRQVFPDLGVCVRRVPGEHRVLSAAARIGHAALGQCAFGSVASVNVTDVEVALLCREALSRKGEAWIHEARERLLARVFPALGEARMHLTVALLLFDQTAYAHFADDSYVGYDPLRGGPAVARRVVLFHGPIPDGSFRDPPGDLP